jgi:hypothetical protein
MNSDSNSGLLELDDEFAPDFVADEAPSATDLSSRIFTRRRTSQTVVAALVISVVGLLGALAWPLLQGQVYTADDLGWFHLPMREFYSQQLARGEAFDWNPDLFCGFYLTGEGQVGSYHPLHWLLYRTLPLAMAFDLECWLSYPLMLFGTYLFLRRWNLRREAAGFGALVFTFSSFNLLHLIHLNAVAIVAHLPWLLWSIDLMLRPAISAAPETKRVRRLAFCSVALLTGSQLLLGYPQYVMYSLGVEAGYVLLMLCLERASLRSAVSGLCKWLLAVSLGAILGAVQLLPTFDALQHSVRQSNASAEFATQGSLPLLNLMQLVTPYLFATRVVGGITHEFGLYMGAVPIVLAAWWVFGGRRNGQTNRDENRYRFRALTNAALITAGFSLLWMMGELGPLGWLQEHVPLVNKFRLPCRAIVIFQLALAVLASLGFAELLGRARKQTQPDQDASPVPSRSNRGQFLWLLPLASGVFSLLALGFWLPYVGPFMLVAWGPAMVAAAVALVLRAAQGARWAVALLVLFTAADLGAYGMSYSVFGHTESLPKYIAKVDVPPGIPPQRIALDLANGTEAAPGQKKVRAGDDVLLRGWQRADGYAGLDPAKQLDYSEPAALQVAGVRWLAADAATRLQTSGHKGWMAKKEKSLVVPTEPVMKLGSSTLWLRLRNPQPLAWLVDRTVVSENPATDIAKISVTKEALVDKDSYVLQAKDNLSDSTTAELPEQNQSDATTNVEANSTGTVTTISDSPGDFAFSANCLTEQFLVVGESYHAGWKATVDGQSKPVARADGDFMGVVVEPGEHKIDLKFQPESLRYGRLTSAFGLGLMVVLLVTVGWPTAWRKTPQRLHEQPSKF